MEMSRYLIIRIVAISIAILTAALALGLWRAQFDIKREELGAAEMVHLFERIYALENGPQDDVGATLDDLERINASGHLRHVRLDLRDAQGRALIGATPNKSPSLLRRAFALFAPGIRSPRHETSGAWTLRRNDGSAYVAALSLNPGSEQQEALDNLVGMLGVLAGYGILMLLAVWWTLKRALAPLQSILGTIAHYERNDFSQRLPTLSFREMDTIGRALNRLAGKLDATQNERRALSLKLVSSQEDERARIARELHDEFGQSLAAIRVDTAWLLRKTANQTEVCAVLHELAEQCEHLHGGIRDLLSDLRAPVALDGGGIPLHRLMDDLLSSWNARPQCTMHFVLRFDADGRAIPDDVAKAVYRLTQEALTNAVSHSRATDVGISLAWTDDDALLWTVEDDGVGIDSLSDVMQRGNGLAGMRERVWALGGHLELGPAREGLERPGLRLTARFDPFRD
jgi:two-component system sensor histidine kinase UhpB